MDAPAAARPTIEQFCGKVCSFVRFSPDHAAITAELKARIVEAAKSFVATYQAANH